MSSALALALLAGIVPGGGARPVSAEPLATDVPRVAGPVPTGPLAPPVAVGALLEGWAAYVARSARGFARGGLVNDRPIELARTGVPELDSGDRVRTSVSFYYCREGDSGMHSGDGGAFCGLQRNGEVVRPGAAACAVEYLGQRFRIEGDPRDLVYECSDTGSAVHGLHRDIWFETNDEGWLWQYAVGRIVTIHILD